MGASKLAAALAALILVGAAAPVSALPEEAQNPRPDATGRALVGPKSGEKQRAEQAIRSRGGRVVEYYEPGDYFVVETPGRAPDFVREMRNEESVRHAELDYEVTLAESTPNDPAWSSLWGMRKIGMPKAWDTATGSKKSSSGSSTRGSFSPNGDGASDYVTISFRLTRQARWAVSVADRVFTGNNAAAGYVFLVWDGKNSLGLPVADGTYEIDVTAIGGPSGTETVGASTTATVDTVGPVISNVGVENVTTGSADIV